MDIEKQLEKCLSEGKIEDVGGHIGRLLYKRYKSSQNVEDRIDALFLMEILILSILTNDKTLMTKSRSNL